MKKNKIFNMEGISIRGKLFIGFSLIILLLILISSIAILKMIGMGKNTVEINKNQIPKVILLNELSREVYNAESLSTKMLLEQDNSEKHKYQEQLKITLEDVKKKRKEYEAYISSSREKKLYNFFSNNWNDFESKVPVIIQSSDAQDLEQGYSVLKGDRSILIYDSILYLTKLSRDEAKLQTEKSVNLFKSGLIFIISLSILAIILGVIITLVISEIISKPLSQLVVQVKAVAKGDLTVKTIEITSRDEIGSLAEDMNFMINNLKDIITQVYNDSELVAATSQQLFANAEQTSNAAVQIAEAIQVVADGTEKQLTTTKFVTEEAEDIFNKINNINLNIDSVTNSSITAITKADEGDRVVSKTIEQMNSINEKVKNSVHIIHKLGEKSKEIEQITSLINNIAGQTNLLALNAAIEAAQAGEQGKGFAVVAEEVRKLAEQSAKAANHISKLINEIQLNTESAIQSMDEGAMAVDEGMSMINITGKTLKEILQSINHVSLQVKSVSSVIKGVNVNTKNMVSSIDSFNNVLKNSAANTQNVSAAVQEQTVSMEEISTSANKLSKMSEELQNSVNSFTL
ncbi:methyl-accepting chemotaxis protein [Clostridium sp. DJ247]|uniref:HAMP domain-containing methyl-accepting chemotaxis protein n=1 Tax=Clostridium sp. DJ247 TaxID=2726188 RepID=UPI001628D4A8|nr:methyl-accepting chemotaxis protein [Clostridium sp. DJ247]MBC2582521.1 methyl-accepting chemotaxis protein [Clostridium sp. DJ247]